MKSLLLFLLFFAAFACGQLRADDAPLIPADLADRPLREWQLDLTTLGIVWFFVRRAYTNLRAGGGIYGMWRGLVYGDKTPDAKARDDAHVTAKFEARRESQAPFPPPSDL